ncbi:MAG TPA: phosphate signaling complex protein PhoU [Edaphocola sp.]|nr:phosphate signaling complex protein PhoU [Edaphocola sp.]
MNPKEQEILHLKEEIKEMWRTIISQLENAKKSFLFNDIPLAMEVNKKETHVNNLELKIDKNCENFIALFNPVAIDLRMALSIMKISVTLERIGDYTNSIARHVLNEQCIEFNKKAIEHLDIERLFDAVINMILDSYVAFDNENVKNAKKILLKDKEVNKIYQQSIIKLTNFVKQNQEDANCVLMMMVLMRNMERIGDHCKNIVEEIVFYLDAKVLKHTGK